MRATCCNWIIIIGALIVLPVRAEQGVGDYRGLPADLAAAATAYDRAQMKADRAGLDRFLADDYTMASTDGKNRNKAEAIAGLTVPGNTTTYVLISQQVSKVWPDGAVLGGMVDAKGVDRGKPYVLHARFVDVWARRDGRWRVIFTQIGNMPPVK